MPSPLSTSAKYRIVVIGSGDMGRTHVQAWNARTDATVVAVCDADPQAAATLANDYQIEAYSDFTKALARIRPDIVSICVPVNLHRLVTETALKAGCHLLVEKPIAGSMEDALAMEQAARTTRRKLAVCYQYRGFFGFAELKARLGRTLSADRLFLRCFDIREVRPKLAMHRKSNNGGPIVDMCGHLFDMARHLFDAEANFVFARGHIFGSAWPRLAGITDPAIDAGEIIVGFGGGHTLSIYVNWGLPENFPATVRWELIGSNFHALIEPNELHLTTAGNTHTLTAPTDTTGPGSRMIDLIHSIEHDCDPEISSTEARKALALSLAALESIETGQVIHLEHP